MKLTELKQELEKTGLKVGYRCMNKQQRLPFIIYFEHSQEAYGDDFTALIKDKTIRVEIYTEIKSIELEERVESILNKHQYKKSETYIEAEKTLLISYDFNFLEKIGG